LFSDRTVPELVTRPLTFYLHVFNMAITCYVIPAVIRYCILCEHGFQQRRYWL